MDTPNIEDLYHPIQKYVNSTSLELLLIETVPLAMRVTEDLSRQMSTDEDQDDSEDGSATTTTAKVTEKSCKHTREELIQTYQQQINLLAGPHADDVYARIESYGYRVGRGLGEILTQDRRGQFADPLDIVKFICKDLWPTVYNKSIDNLKTNHRGTYVLVDTNFGPCKRMSTSRDGANKLLDRATPFLWFPVGLIRGCLEALGMGAQVTFETTELPTVSFHIQSQNK
ncbi:transport protein particle component [Nadsonia fulvescens var. elongata DSM 6958]|uniref:Transport protein particle component n=1 Tax=Nadsonia fulvescens var. elongata DSM 6958 TaxID=857566 RepID=A0A1E3PLY1_9ASCO|nr:transport protein particle component [Nadsonia fulvescens var. elongata DSM 6958]